MLEIPVFRRKFNEINASVRTELLGHSSCLNPVTAKPLIKNLDACDVEFTHFNPGRAKKINRWLAIFESG